MTFTNYPASRVYDLVKTRSVQSSAANGNSNYVNQPSLGVYTFPTDALACGFHGFRMAPGMGYGNIGATLDPWIVACYHAGLKWTSFQSVGWSTETNNGFDETKMLTEFNRVIGLTHTGFIEYVEGPNEPENATNFGTPYWYKGVQTGDSYSWKPLADYQHNLWVKFNAVGIKVLGISDAGASQDDSSVQFATVPTPKPPGTYKAAGTVMSDILTTHQYTMEIQYFGPGVSGSTPAHTSQMVDTVQGDQFDNRACQNFIQGWVSNVPGYPNIAAVNANPIAVTEYGERTDVSSPGVPNTNDDLDAATQGKCLINGYFDAWLKGNYAFLSTYELYSGTVGATGVASGGYGLFWGPGNPKTSGQYFMNWNTIMNDMAANKATFTPGSANMTITGLTANTRTALFQDAIGNFYLWLWKIDANWNPTTKAAITVAGTTPGILFDQAMNVTVTDITTTTPKASGSSVTTCPSFSYNDAATCVKFTPTTSYSTTIQVEVFGTGSGGTDPTFNFSVDGVQIGGNSGVTAIYGSGASQVYAGVGNWNPYIPHTVVVTFVNPGGTPARVFGVNCIKMNQLVQNIGSYTTTSGTPKTFMVGPCLDPHWSRMTITATGAGGRLTASVDGVPTLDSTGLGQLTITGNWTPGIHTLTLTAVGATVTITQVQTSLTPGGSTVTLPGGGMVLTAGSSGNITFTA